MKKICKECKYYKEVEETESWFFGLFNNTTVSEMCLHPNSRDEVSGEPQRCSAMRSLPYSGCGDGKWYEEKA
jgi:hypothetical protein